MKLPAHAELPKAAFWPMSRTQRDEWRYDAPMVRTFTFKWIQDYCELIEQPTLYSAPLLALAGLGYSIDVRERFPQNAGKNSFFQKITAFTGPVVPYVVYNKSLFEYFTERLSKKGVMTAWYKVDKALLLPFTDAPLF